MIKQQKQKLALELIRSILLVKKLSIITYVEFYMITKSIIDDLIMYLLHFKKMRYIFYDRI